MASFSKFGNDLYTGARSYNIIGRRRIWFSIAGVLILIAILVPVFKGFNFSVEFSGGSEFTVSNVGQNPSQATATVTFKIPEAVYSSTLAALSGSGLGTQLSLSQQAQDVTQQVADVSSRVTSDEAAIAQLRALLAHAGSVGELLSVQDQINNEETDLESMLAQQTALSHETSYATVTLTLVGPKAVVKARPKQAPPGLNGGLSRGWHAFRVTISWLLTVLGAVAPFAAVVALIGGLGWWARRRVTRGRRRPDSPVTASGGDGA